MPILTSAESKQFTHDTGMIYQYPSYAEVDTADRLQRCQWYRFLRSPQNDEEHDILKIIIKSLRDTYPKTDA